MSINFETASPHKILEHVSDGGDLNRQAIETLRKHHNADWIVDLHEAEFLFHVNEAIGDREDVSELWPEFFAETIGRLLLFDLHTPGEIDEAEGNWLSDMLARFGCANKAEKQLVQYISDKAQKIGGRFAS